MRKCWEYEAKRRPSFAHICDALSGVTPLRDGMQLVLLRAHKYFILVVPFSCRLSAYIHPHAPLPPSSRPHFIPFSRVAYRHTYTLLHPPLPLQVHTHRPRTSSLPISTPVPTGPSSPSAHARGSSALSRSLSYNFGTKPLSRPGSATSTPGPSGHTTPRLGGVESDLGVLTDDHPKVLRSLSEQPTHLKVSGVAGSGQHGMFTSPRPCARGPRPISAVAEEDAVSVHTTDSIPAMLTPKDKK